MWNFFKYFWNVYTRFSGLPNADNPLTNVLVFFYFWIGGSSRLSASYASLSKDYWAYLYNLTSLISLTILTILPAFVPTLDALPALASYAAYEAPAASELLNKGPVTHPISNSRDNVETISSQKKNPLK